MSVSIGAEPFLKKLLERPIHKVAVGAVSSMDWQARNKQTPEWRRKELLDLYIKRHDRIDDWDLVDRSAAYVVGGYLSDKPRNLAFWINILLPCRGRCYATPLNIWRRNNANIIYT